MRTDWFAAFAGRAVENSPPGRVTWETGETPSAFVVRAPASAGDSCTSTAQRITRYSGEPSVTPVSPVTLQKADIVDLLAVFHGRAGVAQHDGGLPKFEAEILAFEEALRELGRGN